jgi:hypothetical protein
VLGLANVQLVPLDNLLREGRFPRKNGFRLSLDGKMKSIVSSPVTQSLALYICAYAAAAESTRRSR